MYYNILYYIIYIQYTYYIYIHIHIHVHIHIHIYIYIHIYICLVHHQGSKGMKGSIANFAPDVPTFSDGRWWNSHLGLVHENDGERRPNLMFWKSPMI
jgi:hypothetical protein